MFLAGQHLDVHRVPVCLNSCLPPLSPCDPFVEPEIFGIPPLDSCSMHESPVRKPTLLVLDDFILDSECVSWCGLPDVPACSAHVQEPVDIEYFRQSSNVNLEVVVPDMSSSLAHFDI